MPPLLFLFLAAAPGVWGSVCACVYVSWATGLYVWGEEKAKEEAREGLLTQTHIHKILTHSKEEKENKHNSKNKHTHRHISTYLHTYKQTLTSKPFLRALTAGVCACVSQLLFIRPILRVCGCVGVGGEEAVLSVAGSAAGGKAMMNGWENFVTHVKQRGK